VKVEAPERRSNRSSFNFHLWTFNCGGPQAPYRRFSVSGSMTPRRKSVTWLVLEETTMAMQLAARLIPAAAACRLPNPLGSE
jgi:hypothetical protein